MKPGEKLPSELEFMKQYNCSRMTVSKALSPLVSAGLLQRRRRAGTIVASRPTESMVLDIPDLPQEIARRGKSYSFRLIERCVRAPSSEVASEAALANSGSILVVKGVHCSDDQPFAYEDRLVSVSAVPEIVLADFAMEPPGSWLLRRIPWTEAENRITAVAASEEWARLLGIDAGSACLSVERRTSRGQEGITHVRQIFVAGQYELVARFGAS